MDFSFLVKIKVFAKISEQNYKNNNSLVFYLFVRQVGNVICHKNKGGNDEYISVSSCSLQRTVTEVKQIK
jgi:hypothetical protein